MILLRCFKSGISVGDMRWCSLFDGCKCKCMHNVLCFN
jgi:hypothetical protein